MYELFRDKVLSKLPMLASDDLTTVARVMDEVADGFTFTKKETGLAVPDYTDFPDEVKLYLVTKKIEGLSDKTLESYELVLKLFFSSVKKPLSEIQTNDVRMFIYQYQKDRNIQSVTINKYLEYVKRFFKWAFSEKYIPTDPTYNIGAIKCEKKQRRSLTQLELETIRMACTDPREEAIIELLYSTGCRLSELCDLKMDDINWQESTVHLFGKGKKHRTSYLNAKAKICLKKYLETRKDDSEYVIVTSRSPYRKMSKAGLERAFNVIVVRAFGKDYDKITPHTMRHTTATMALQRGMPVTDISKLLGHESVNTTMIYAEVSEESVKNNHRKCIN